MVAWVASRDTLVGVMSLESVSVETNQMSGSDGSMLFPLLLTSASLREFEFVDNGCEDEAIYDVSWYVVSASLRMYKYGGTKKLSKEAFMIQCVGVAHSTVRRFDLCLAQLEKVDLETMVEWLAWMIWVSSLEEVRMESHLGWYGGRIRGIVSALRLTAPVRNMDFTLTQIVDCNQHILRINRKWKPLGHVTRSF
jgi:hypothetical protein